jgi:hypothetical protein
MKNFKGKEFIMKVELVKQTFNGTRGYKIRKREWCCKKLKANPCIGLFDKPGEYGYEYDNDDEEIEEAGKDYDANDIPAVMIERTETVSSYEDEWENAYYYPISFCPFCGEKIEVSVVEVEDMESLYHSLINERELLWERSHKTDSKKEEEKLIKRVRELDGKINRLYILVEEK